MFRKDGKVEEFLTPEMVQARDAFVLQYIAKKKWDRTALTHIQVAEICSQAGYKNPKTGGVK